MMKKFLLLLAFLTGVTGFGQTVNPTYSPAQFFANPPAILAIRLSQVGVQFPSWQPKTIYIGTNSSVTFSNVPTGYSYGVDFIQNFWTPPTSWTNTFPANISGTVNATNWIFYTQTFQGPPYYPSGSTNGGTPLLSGTNTFVDNLNGSNRVNVPFGIFDANGSAAEVQSYLSSICMTNNDTRQFTFSGGGWQFSGPAFQIGNTGSGIFWYGTYLTTVGSAYFSGNGSGLTNIPAAAIVGLSSGTLTNVVVNTLNGITNSVSISGSTATINVGTSNQFTVANAATLASALQSVPVGATNLFTTTSAVLGILASSGAVTNAPYQQTAANFIAANPSLNGELQKEINAWCFEYNYGASQTNSGFNWTNLVDKVIIDGRWGTNITTLNLRTVWMTNVTVVPLDGVLNFSSVTTGGIAVSNLPDMRPPFTIAMTWNHMGQMPGSGTSGFMTGLFDTNQLTGCFLELNHAPSVYASNGSVSNLSNPYGSGTFVNVTAPFQYSSYWIYSDYESRVNDRNNTVISVDTNGIATAWENGVQSKFNYAASGFTYATGVTNYPNPLTVLRVLNSFNSVCCSSGNYQYAHHGAISGITLFNCVANSNLVKAVFYADQEIIPDTTRRIFIGDSKWAATDQNANIGDCAPNLFQISSGHQYERAHWNYAQPSQYLSSYVDTNSSYRINNLMAPHGRVTRTEVWNQACSVNQFFSYGGPLTSSNVWNQLTNYLTACNSNNEALFVTTCSTISSNNYITTFLTNNAANDLQRVTFNSMLRTNAYLFAGIADNDANVDQAVMNTNNTPKLSLDGIHPDVIPTGYPWNPIVMQWADQMLHPQQMLWSQSPLY